MNERFAYRVSEAAEALGISRTELYKLIGRGVIRTVRFGSRARVPVEEIKRIAEEGYPAAQPPR